MKTSERSLKLFNINKEIKLLLNIKKLSQLYKNEEEF